MVGSLVCWPTLVTLSDTVPGSTRTDLWNSLWSLWWFQDQIWSGSFPLHLDLLDFPRASGFFIADPLNALLLTPLIPLLGIPVSYSLLVWGHLIFSGVAAHLLARRLHGSEVAGAFAGTAYCLAPVLVSGIQSGTSESMAGGWLALSVMALLKAVERGGRRPVLFAAGGLVLTCLGGWYAGLCAWIVWGALLLFGWPGVQRARSTRRLLAAGVVAAVVCVPLAASMTRSIEQGQQIGIKSERELNTVRRTTGAADPRGWFVPGDWRSPDFREISRDNEEFVHSHYLGWTLIFGSLMAVLRRGRRLGALGFAGGVGALLAMGPVVVLDGRSWVFGEQLAMPLPYFLVEDFPGFSSLSLLFRLGVLPALVLAVAAAGWVGTLPRKRALFFCLLKIIEFRFLSPVAGLTGAQHARVGSAIEALKTAPPGAVMNYPIVGGRPYLFEQIHHQKPIAGRLNFPNNHASKKIWTVLAEASELSGDDARRRIRSIAQKTQTGACEEVRAECDYGELRASGQGDSCRCVTGVRYLVIHQDAYARPDMHQDVVKWASETLPVLAEDAQTKVIQLW
ncbi:MAG: hypothetical protein VXW32_07645 [Myxococcota bacterium]|nr:hypothetical protein [Myxococcota bacterium]